MLHYEIPKRVQAGEFVRYWSNIYDYRNEQLYISNITAKLTPTRLRQLYFWKNGGPLSKRKKKSVEKHYISRIPDLRKVSKKLGAKEWLEEFGHGRAIWDIFFLHIWNQTYPIFDQHVYRAMKYIRCRELHELPQKESDRIRIYLEEYLPFYKDRLRELDLPEDRELDKALWRFGKFLKPLK
jgi:hypothetical protein